MRRLYIWGCIFLVSLITTRVESCSCLLQHPQTHFCESDFVAVVRIKNVAPFNIFEGGEDGRAVSSPEIAYKTNIKKIFKATDEANDVLRKNVLWTPSVESVCGVHLDIGDTYIVSGRIVGGKARISICGLFKKWSTVTSQQRKRFRKFYQRGCVCKIRYTPWYSKSEVFTSTGGKVCLWESTPGPQDCQEQNGICMLGPGGCSWVPSLLYKECILSHKRQREQQKAREP